MKIQGGLYELTESPDIVDEVNEFVTYIGWAESGTLIETEEKFKIKRISRVGTVTTTTWASGNNAYNKAWSLRATYNYQFLR